MKKFLKTLFELLIYPVIPKICVYCKTPLDYDEEYYICKNCYHEIKFILGLVCQKCGLPLPDGGAHCYNCKTKERKWWLESIKGAVEYKEPIKTLIHELKYNNKPYLSNFFSFLLIKNFFKNFGDTKIDIITSVPMVKIKKFFRGYNQAELVAKRFSELVLLQSQNKNIKFFPQIIIRKKFTVSQFKLSREERLENVKDVFEVRDKEVIKDKTILIIDDVCTTGETLNQCAKVLIKSKARKVFGYVVARDV
jgi:ComF family protein